MDLDKWQVLVVEDEHDSVQMVSKILTYSGIQVHVARHGLECLEMLKTLEPTAVVMDLAMPSMDGWQTLVQIRANPALAHIPVVAMTAYHSANVAEDAVRAGFDAYFSKPIEPRTFVQSLQKIVDHTE